MYAPEKMSSQIFPFSMMELTEQPGKQLCLQKGIVDSSTRQKCWGWRKNPARWFCHWSQCVVKLQLSWSELSCHPPGLGSSFLLLHLSSAAASLWPCCMLCVPGPQVSSLGGSKAMRSLSDWRSLLWDSSYLRSMWRCCETAPIVLRLVLLLSVSSGWNLVLVKPTSNTHWWSRARISLSVASCATVEKKHTFFFFYVLGFWVIILNFQC